MAKQLEVSLYRNARSFEEYMDIATLKQRLQLIAMEVSRKSKNQSGGNSSSTDRQRSSDRNTLYSNNGMHAPQHHDMMRGSSQGAGAQSQSPYTNNQGNNLSSSSQQQILQQQQQQQMSTQRQRVNMNDINPMAGGSSAGNSDVMRGPSTSDFMGASRSSMHDPSAGRNSSSLTNNDSSVLPQRNDPEWRIRIRHKQQRLLLLHHSAKCPHDIGTCTVTPHCSDMKRLWRHMEGCKDNNCRVPHCFSSRTILSHYRKCKDAHCPACGPVRETVRKAAKINTSASRPDQRLNNSSTSMQNQISASFSIDNRISSTTPPQDHSMVSASPDPIAANMPGGSYGASSMNFPHQPRSSSQSSSMPPPASASSSSGVQYQSSSSSYRPSNQVASNAQTVSQPLYNQKLEPMSIGSNRNDKMPSSGAPIAPLSVANAGESGTITGSRSRDSTEWQKVRHKQQRLLLLRHASKCQFEAGKCPVTPHCASMKELWEHIAHCKNQQCRVQHCLSSRYVLSHYRRCKDPRCPACGPVRETIRKGHEKEKNAIKSGAENSSDLSTLPSMDIGMSLPSEGNSNKTPPQNTLMSSEPRQKRPKLEHSGPMPSEQPLLAMGIPTSSSGVSTVPAVKREADAPVKPVVEVTSSLERPATSSTSTSRIDDHSLLNSFSIKEIELHLASLHRAVQMPPAKLKTKCSELLKGLQSHTHGWVFNTPVDPVELGLPDYFDIIKKPMDLGTVNKKLDSGMYHFIEDFAAEVNLTFDNAMTYNEEHSVVYDMAKELKAKFIADHRKLMTQLEAEDREARKNDRACTLCGCEKLLFEPPVFFCNGMNCQSTRIRRNSHFYVGANGQFFWCNQCYNELDGSIPIELVDTTIMKSDLKKRKNDEVHEESWVQCDECESWIHQICGLFNTRQNKEHNSKYFCPKCLLQKRKAGLMPSPRPPSASELPRTKLSDQLENHVHRKVAERKAKLAKEKVETEKITLEEAMKKLECGPVTIRQVTATDRKLEVREYMKKRYAHKNYPDEFPFRCKCLVVFQNIDGVDVVLFALYVYEHGPDNPPPNQRCVYISYLDSVHFMRPRRLRTFLYHELLICYLDYARMKGFSTAHIWACPPLKGDDYIFYAKPEDQKTPRDARLRQWYVDMLVECQRRNICGKVTNMYDLYLDNESLDATCMPYLEGDYFPGEAENIIKDLEEGGGKKNGGGGKKSKKKSSKSKGRGGRSDDDSPYGEEDDGPPKGFKEGGRDEVMVKLGEAIQPMKESFMVAFLNWSGAKPENLVVPDEIVQYRKEAEANGSAEAERLKRIIDISDAKDENGQPIKVIDDDDEDMDCEFLNNRQAFLNLCRGNHYQFDELRRAKHTSMMVLWHLHNRDAPKFVQQCASCSREILTGTRYHCNTCPEYDLCEECYRNPKTNRGACSHRLHPIAVETEKESQSGGSNGLTEEERRERQHNLKLHIQLIEHASRCKTPLCGSSNCAKMKSYLQHGKTCTLKASGGCKICKRIWTLLRIHAQKCKDSVCPIPQCMAIRERIRQLAKQQQAMDDRRRQEMNRAFRMGVAAHQGG